MYTLQEVEDLQAFFDAQDIDESFDFVSGDAYLEINRRYVNERLQLMRSNFRGLRDESVGMSSYEVLVAVRRYLSDRRPNDKKML